jgi:hypothetical protein
MIEPNYELHYIFNTHAEAHDAWSSLPEDIQELIQPPRQSHDCWIFDKIVQE